MISPPKKAFVLAAGFGTRMLPLTKTTPKPLMPFWGKPLIDRTLEMLREWGVSQVCLNLHHLPESIIEHLAKNHVRGLAISFSREEEILGTGGALPQARCFLEDGEPFWMINADVAMQLDPARLLRAFNASGLAACWLHGASGPRTVEMSRGIIAGFRSKRPKSEGTYTFCGVQLLSPRILDFLPPQGFATIVEGYEAAMKAGHKIAGVEIPDSFWADVGTPQQYLAAHNNFLGNRKPFIAKSAGVKIARGAKIEDAILWHGAQIGPRARVRDSIIGRECVVNFPVIGKIALRACDALTAPELVLLKKAGWPETATVIPLGPRGSNRSFTRIWSGDRKNDSPKPALPGGILVHYDPVRVENALYAGHARFLAVAGFPVPKLLADDPLHCNTLIEDLGDDSIQSKFRGATEAAREKVYRDVLDAVLILHGTASGAARRKHLRMVSAFNPGLYRWEREYFAEHMLEKRLGLAKQEIAGIKKDLRKIGQQLFQAPLVIVHRDLQSSNVILKDGKPYFIDFQGMRWGPAAYDLASLLCDPYMELSGPLQLRLLDYYAEKSGDRAILDLFWPATIQRLAQALGAFAKLGAAHETHEFAGHIPAALNMMSRALEHVVGLPHLRAWCANTLAR